MKKWSSLLVRIVPIILIGCLCGCLAPTSESTAGDAGSSITETSVPPVTTEPKLDVETLAASLAAAQTDADQSFCLWLAETFAPDLLQQMTDKIEQSGYSRNLWYEVTGNTLHVLQDLYFQAAEKNSNIHLVNVGKPGQENQTTTLVFGGDISFADNYATMQYMASAGGNIEDCIDPALIQIMKDADIAFMNNEFCISDRGSPLVGKQYTFRAAPANTSLYQTLGIDLVSLANNHAYDYGKDAFLDTLDALQTYGIVQIGGGKNLAGAMTPQYYIINGRKIAFVAATRAEKNKMTPQATETSPGVLRCYDTELFLKVIEEADANSDFVIACIHWGTEYAYALEEAQTTTARAYMDAGVDLIIGAHAHQLQGIEFYDGKAIFYNLGNFWFNRKNIDTGLVRAEIKPDGEVSYTFLPALQKDCVTTSQIGTEHGGKILQTLRKYSINTSIDDNGVVTEAKIKE